jgi:myo-inositol-1(or 4)-monophosphatase
LPSPEIADRLAWAEDISDRVGKLLMGSFRTGLTSSDKAAGIVTQLDTQAEELIAAELKASFPGDGLLAEEGTDLESTTGYRWIADPLDGTTNYVAGIPHFAVCLACLKGDKVELGVVHSPAMAETFKVARGEGATGPDGPLKAKETAALKKAVFLLNKCYLPSPVLWETAKDLLEHIRAFRYLGCISLDIAYVAAGRVDGLILLPAEPWDIGPGLALLEASGARFTDLSGRPVPVGKASGIVATAPDLLEQVLPLVHFQN